jgi:hypothetical protein
MRQLTVFAVVAVVAWGSAAEATTAGAKRASSCDRRAGMTLVANKEVRVFQREKRVDGVLASVSTYACNRQTGRLRSFGDAESGKDSGSTRLPTVAGPYVAYIATPGGPVGSVVVWSSRTGATRIQGTATQAEERPDGSAPPVTALVVTAKGHVAWIVGPTGAEGGYTVRTTAPAADVVVPALGSGTDIVPTSLAAAGGVVYWTQGGAARSAPLP